MSRFLASIAVLFLLEITASAQSVGKIKEYKEYYGECNCMHCFDVTLESGDKLDFEEGYLMGYEMVSSRFSSSNEC